MDGQTDAWTTRRTKQRMAFETHEQMKEKTELMEEGIKGLVIELKKHKLRRKEIYFCSLVFPCILNPFIP